MQNQYWTSDDPRLIARLAKAFADAAENGSRIRIKTTEDNSLIFKIGEGMWSPPHESDPDPYRD